jgi:hypothetical protein
MISAPGFATGLNDEQRSILKTQAEMAAAPQQFNQLADARKLEKQLALAFNLLTKMFTVARPLPNAQTARSASASIAALKTGKLPESSGPAAKAAASIGALKAGAA